MHEDPPASKGAAGACAIDDPGRDERAREADLARALGEEACRQDAGRTAILLAGRRGSGRTRLARALAAGTDGPQALPGAAPDDAPDGRQGLPAFRHGRGVFSLLDPRGFGGVQDHGECQRRQLALARTAGAVLLCVPAPDRAWGLEAGFLQSLAEALPGACIFCAGTKIDLLPPARVWQPGRLSPKRPKSPKDLAIARWEAQLLAFLRRSWKGFSPQRLSLVSAGADPEGSEPSFGLEELSARLAAGVSAQAGPRQASARDRRAQAERIVWKAALAAAAAAAVPIPFAEAAFLAPLQIAMCASLANLYGAGLGRGTAARLLAPALAGFIGRIGLVSLLDFVPGPGSLAGSLLAAGIAGPATLAVGEAFADSFERGVFEPRAAEIARLVRERYRLALLRRDEILRQAGTGQGGEKDRQDAQDRQCRGTSEAGRADGTASRKDGGRP